MAGRERHHRDRAANLLRKRQRYAENRELRRAEKRDAYARDIEAVRLRSKKRAEYWTVKGAARAKLHEALKKGHIIKPASCQRCGTVVPKKKLHGHHHDYSRPLDVAWLCTICHGIAHRSELTS